MNIYSLEKLTRRFVLLARLGLGIGGFGPGCSTKTFDPAFQVQISATKYNLEDEHWTYIEHLLTDSWDYFLLL